MASERTNLSVALKVVRVHLPSSPRSDEGSIMSIEKHDAEVEDLVEKFQNALHAETERGNALAVRVAELEAEAREPVRLGRNVEMRGSLVVVRRAPTCPHCRDEDDKRLGCRACEETGLLHLEDIRPDYDELLEAIDARNEGIKTLRAELAGAQSQATAAKREAEVQNRACAEEMLKREAMQKNWDAMVTSVREHYDARLNAEAMLRARDAEVPGLSKLPYYTPADAKRIAETKGKPYARLAVTAEMADLAVDIATDPDGGIGPLCARILKLAATGNETKEVES